jgi:hypothetical protein
MPGDLVQTWKRSDALIERENSNREFVVDSVSGAEDRLVLAEIWNGPAQSHRWSNVVPVALIELFPGL